MLQKCLKNCWSVIGEGTIVFIITVQWCCFLLLLLFLVLSDRRLADNKLIPILKVFSSPAKPCCPHPPSSNVTSVRLAIRPTIDLLNTIFSSFTLFTKPYYFPYSLLLFLKFLKCCFGFRLSTIYATNNANYFRWSMLLNVFFVATEKKKNKNFFSDKPLLAFVYDGERKKSAYLLENKQFFCIVLFCLPWCSSV